VELVDTLNGANDVLPFVLGEDAARPHRGPVDSGLLDNDIFDCHTLVVGGGSVRGRSLRRETSGDTGEAGAQCRE
jgi:hypothetical protein